MCSGVTSGFAGVKFSVSPKIYGKARQIQISVVVIINMPIKSFQEWKEWNGILSMFELIPRGLDDPVWCRKRRCTITAAAIMNGKRKWMAKNRVNVAFPTENPPQIHWTVSWPIYGIADRRLVITVAPQNDICPHGRTYPTNAVAIVSIKRVTPINQVCFRK